MYEIPGIKLDASRRLWKAFVKVEGEFRHMGRFRTRGAAIVARGLALEYYGQPDDGHTRWLNSDQMAEAVEEIKGKRIGLIKRGHQSAAYRVLVEYLDQKAERS
ncbi:hypothetical protein [Ruegeria atlantica]|uniref:hypothetical protein n=1 Tax=Ruegeria atlantica TaxID=81569 RepID=UPI00147B5A90|nr:hypothetical protein [Ruegeria atlantica]